MDKYSKQKGFTLVEMIVSIAIFTIVALVAVGALLKTIDANKKSQSLKTSINNINFVLESMSRELRTGSNYFCTSDSEIGEDNDIVHGNQALPASRSCTPGALYWIIAFYSSRTYTNANGSICNLVYVYRFANGTIEKAEQSTCNDTIRNNNSNTFFPVVSSDIIFTTATINVETKEDAEDRKQPYIFIHLKGYSGKKEKNKTYFDVQTSVSQRLSE